MMILNKAGFHAVILLFVFMMLGCGSYSKVQVTKNDKSIELNDASRREYNYALTEATKQKVFGNLPQAAALYRKCIEVNPKSDVAFYQLGILYMRAGNNREAINYTLRAVELNNENYWYLLQLASLYRIEQNTDSVIIVFEEIYKLWPDNNEIRVGLALNYAEKNRDEEAIKMLNMIESENGISEKVSLIKEQIFSGNGNYENAIVEVNKLLAIAPGEIKYLGILAELYGTAGMNEKAMECYNRIFEIEPDNGLAQLSLADYYKGTGDVVKRYEKFTEAFNNEKIKTDKKLEVLIILSSDQKELLNNKENIEKLINIMLKQYPGEYRTKTVYGDFLVKTGRFDEAIRQFEEALVDQKTNYFIWEQLIFLYSSRQELDKVYDKCLEALKLFPEKPLLYLFKGNVESSREEYEKSIDSFEKGLKFAGSNEEMKMQFLSFLAEAYRSVGDNQKSDDNFQKALEIDPENPILLNNYGYYLALRHERLNEAEKMSRITIINEPQNSTYLDTYAWILYKMDKFKKALEYIEAAIKYGGTEDPDILEHYGDILIELGRQSEALECWKLAIKYGGQEGEINKKIEKAGK